MAEVAPTRYTRGMEDSIFTKIINGEIPAHRIYEDDDFIVFLDVHPLTAGHTLVVPKVQVDHLWELDELTYQNLFALVRRVGTHLKATLAPPRVGVVVEGFGVPHVHVHLIPMQDGHDLKRLQDVTAIIDHQALADLAKQLQLT